MSNNIIELRQQDGRTIGFGEYENMLSKEITINDGDTVILKQAFIDTKKSSTQSIIIEEDITLSLTNGLYLTDWYQAAEKTYYNIQGNSQTNPVLDGKDYILYSAETFDASSLYQMVEGYKYTLNNATTIQQFTITYNYLDQNNQPQQYQKVFPTTGPSQNVAYTHSFLPAFLVAQSGTFIYSSPTFQQLKQLGIFPIGPELNGEPFIQQALIPKTYTTTFTLSAGSYNPSDLADIISKNLSKTNTNTNAEHKIVSSNFLTTFGAVGAANYLYIRNNDNEMSIKPSNTATTSQLAVGAEQIQLAFNSQTNKFEWDYLHSPMRDNVKGQDISVRYLYQGLTSNSLPPIAVAKNGGIYFTDLSATVSETGKTFDFWTGKLGFDLKRLLVVPEFKNQRSDYFGFSDVYMYNINITDGQQTTNGYYGLDSAILKNSVNAWVSFTNIPTGQNGITSTISDTTSIIADASLDELLDRYSHFIITSDLKFNNNVLGKDIYKQVQSIITKYYSFEGNYTYGDSSGSIVYQHKGAPILLKSVKIRILKSDKTTDASLGDDSTIYFQIIKAQTEMKSSRSS